MSRLLSSFLRKTCSSSQLRSGLSLSLSLLYFIFISEQQNELILVLFCFVFVFLVLEFRGWELLTGLQCDLAICANLWTPGWYCQDSTRFRCCQREFSSDSWCSQGNSQDESTRFLVFFLFLLFQIDSIFLFTLWHPQSWFLTDAGFRYICQ